MREAHAMYPFTGKRDKELFDKALAEVCTYYFDNTFQVAAMLQYTCAVS